MQYIAFTCCFEYSEPYSGINFGEVRRVEIATGQIDIIDSTTLTIGGGTSPLCWTSDWRVVKRRGAGLDELANCSYGRSAAFSPDGTQIASSTPASPDDDYWEGDSLLTARQTDTGEVVWQRQISGHATNPRWSLDGSAIIFQRGTAANKLSIWRIAVEETAVPEQIISNGYLLDVIPQW